MKESISPYHFGTEGQEPKTYCTEYCKVSAAAGGKIRIGSVACQECPFCVEHDGNGYDISPSWIKCSRIEEARGLN